ncbi:site-specific recombination directionality factor RDF [Mycobacterium phage MyraDee]|uniref:Uncharacterized protein n=1 Tax=Mycobacterium phage MyraDee TaxID=2024303 RepID=A0A222Z0A6_9CAUD|nr:site-specific recombination directionality factor RDF [Mycobacterium phage MyraDee]ASR77186.1 hypothetical protein SEA_MYRADEE_79 [Mycobacterium phage MyraDee]
MRTVTILAGLVGAVIIGNAPAIIAEASAGPGCERRSAAHIAEHGGIKADSAWHIAHGERPTCDDEKPRAHEGSGKDKDRDKDDDRKSRFCRTHWYC